MKSEKLETGEFAPPEGLSERSQALWRELVPSRARSPGRLELLGLALVLRDRITELRAAVGSEYVVESLTTKTKHAHPGAKLLADSEKQFRQLWTDLHLGWDATIDGRVTLADLDDLGVGK
jgi:hypothetical protein